MASVRKGLAAGRGSPAAKPNPQPQPKKPLRRPPTPERRRRRDPRDHPARPVPKQPPKVPRFTPPRRSHPNPFGKHPLQGVPPGTGIFRPGVWGKLARTAIARGLPVASAAIPFILWYYDRGPHPGAGWRMCWSTGGGPLFSGPIRADCPGAGYVNLGGQVPRKPPVTTIAPGRVDQAIFYGTPDNPEMSRMTYREMWARPAVPGASPEYPKTWINPPVNLPLPGIWPFGEPLPYAPLPPPDFPPPIKPRPKPRRDPRPEPKPDPVPETPLSTPYPGVVPSIDLVPESEFPLPDFHVKEPPGDKDREKKKRLGPRASTRWMKILGFIGTFTEFDDFIRALYDTIPWKYRRWRGRDGVWRERHATTQERANFLIQHIGRTDVNKAVDEVYKAVENIHDNDLKDMLWAKFSQQISTIAAKAGDQVGMHFRMPDMNHESWQAFKAIKRAQFNEWWLKGAPVARPLIEGKGGSARWYTKRVQLPNGTWVDRRIERPRTQIPWYRQEGGQKRYPVFDNDGNLVAYRYGPRVHYRGGRGGPT